MALISALGIFFSTPRKSVAVHCIQSMRKLKPVEQQWLFTDSALHHTPSQDDGVSYVEELERRALALQYVRSLAFRAGM